MRKLFSVLLLICLLFLFVGCGEDKEAVTTSEEEALDDSDAYEDEDYYEEEEPSGEVSDPNDEMAFYKINNPEEYQDQPILVRNGQFYLLKTMFENGTPANGSYQFGKQFPDGVSIMLYTSFYYGDKEFVRSFGAVPKITIEAGDSIIVYSSNSVPTICFDTQYSHHGSCLNMSYLIPFSQNDYSLLINSNPKNERSWESVTELIVQDSNGNSAEDIYNLQKDNQYTVTWFSGTEHCEESLVADSECYKKESVPSYKIEGSLNQNGYAEYDIQSIPAGFYNLVINTGGSSSTVVAEIVEVKN